jgi:hypothetical protein
MRAVVKKPFDLSHDGIHVISVRVGEEHDIDESIFPGLEKAGYVKKAPAPEPVTAAPADAEVLDSRVFEADEIAQDAEGDALTSVAPEDAEAVESGGQIKSAEDAPTEQAQPKAPHDIYVRHIGRGKYAVFNGARRLTEEAMTQAQAQAARDAMLRAGPQK